MKKIKEIREELAQTCSLSPSFFPILAIFIPPCPLFLYLNATTFIPGQLSQVRACVFSLSRILWNLHLTDLEVLDRKEHMKQREDALCAQKCRANSSSQSFSWLPLRNGQRYSDPRPTFRDDKLLPQDPRRFVLRVQLGRNTEISRNNAFLLKEESSGAVTVYSIKTTFKSPTALAKVKLFQYFMRTTVIVLCQKFSF